MKNEDKTTLDPMKNWVSEVGTETPAEGFHLSVLKKIEALPQTSAEYRPVISALGWKLIWGFIISIFAGSIIFVPSQPETSSLFDKLPPFRVPAVDFRIYDFIPRVPDLSTNLLLGIGTFFIMGSLLIVSTLYHKRANV
jgi:hypothetical protein